MANLSGQNPQNIRLSTKGGLEVALLNYGASLKSIRVPEDGTSAADLWGMESESPAYNVVDGIVYFDWLDSNAPLPRDVPQSLKTLTEPVSFNNPEALTLPVTFIAYVAPGQTVEERSADPSWQNARTRNWTIRTLDSDHNAQRSHPEELAALLEVAPNDRNQP